MSLQLFGVAPAQLVGRRFIVEGKKAAAVAHGNLALVIRELDAEWNPGALEQNLANRVWLSRQAALQQSVLERAMIRGPVVPAGLCTVLQGRAELEALARLNADRWSKSLVRLAGKQEWCLHIYAGPHVASHAEPYLLRVAPASSERTPIDGPHNEHLSMLWKACSALSAGSRRIEPLGNPQYIFGATFLLRRLSLREFRGVLMRFAALARESGLTYYLDGPHPTFTIVEP